jgi:DHA1 family multidrug resistance protein-like MFS transporter
VLTRAPALSPVTLLSLQNASLLLGHNLVAPSLPPYAKSLGVEVSLVGAVVGAFSVGRIVADVPAGLLGDRYARMPWFVVGAVIVCAGSLVAALVSDFWILVAARFLQGIGAAVFSTMALAAIVAMSASDERGEAMSHYQASTYLAAASGPVVGGIVAELWGYQSPFVFFAVISGALAVWMAVAAPRRGSAPVRALEASSALGGTTLRALAGIGLFNVAFYSVRSGLATVVLPLIASARFGMRPGEIGMLQALILILNLAAIVATGRFLTEGNMRRALVVSVATMAVGLGVFVAAGSMPVLVLALALFALGSGIGLPVPPMHAAKHSEEGARGFGAGIFRFSNDLGLGLGPISASVAVGADPTALLFSVVGGAAMGSALFLPGLGRVATAAPDDVPRPDL